MFWFSFQCLIFGNSSHIFCGHSWLKIAYYFGLFGVGDKIYSSWRDFCFYSYFILPIKTFSFQILKIMHACSKIYSNNTIKQKEISSPRDTTVNIFGKYPPKTTSPNV